MNTSKIAFKESDATQNKYLSKYNRTTKVFNIMISRVSSELKGINKFWRTKLAKDAFALYAGRGTNLIVGIFSTLIYGVVFLNSQIATINLFEMVVNLFVSFGFSWSAFGIIRFGKEEYLENKTINYTSSIRLSITVPLLFVSILIILFFRSKILNYVGTNDTSIIIYIILNIIFLVFHEHITRIFTTAERHVWNAVFFFGRSIGRLGILCFFYFEVLNVSAEMYIKLNVFYLFTLALVRLPFLNKNYILPIKFVKQHEIISFAKYVLPQIYGFAGLYLINWIDVYFIRKYCSPDELGAYQFLYIIFIKFASFAIILNALFFPKVVSWKKNNQLKLKNFAQKSPYGLLVLTSLGIILVFIVYQPVFSAVFKEKFEVAYPSFNILLCVVPFHCMTFIFVPILNSYDKVGYIQIINIISALSNLVIDFVLIQKFGLIGAAFGTFIAYFSQFNFLMAAVKKLFNIKYSLLILITYIILIIVILYFFKATRTFL